MRKHARESVSAVVLCCGIWALVVTSPVQAQIAAAQKDVLDLAKDVEKGKVAPGRGAAIHKKYDDLLDLMIGFKPRAKQGIGYGAKGEGIEVKLNDLGKRALRPGQLAAEKNNLLKMAYINLAYAEIVPHYAPAKPNAAGKGAKDWKRYSADLKKASREFLDAVKNNKPGPLQKAANNMVNSCNGCHTDFR